MNRMRVVLVALVVAWMAAACDNSNMKSMVEYPDADSPEFQVFAKNCSFCHAPPAPDVHPADEWPGVISRMNNYRIQRAYGAINAGDKTAILKYLASHAKVETAEQEQGNEVKESL